ncbi:MAG TPA: hypothetical protein VMD05_11150 [Candidatus Nanoarchaeia archaeon]|nr:hypothetical protein [Candidatus Nanoarchaeia archaeon]
MTQVNATSIRPHRGIYRGILWNGDQVLFKKKTAAFSTVIAGLKIALRIIYATFLADVPYGQLNSGNTWIFTYKRNMHTNNKTTVQDSDQ